MNSFAYLFIFKKKSMLILQDLQYLHPNNILLFDQLNVTVNSGEKIALIGNNGTGKSTLLQIIYGQIKPSSGHVFIKTQPYYVPQNVGLFDQLTIAQVLQVENKLKAFNNIMKGSTSAADFEVLNDNWLIEEEVAKALSFWNLSHLTMNQLMKELSGGEKIKIFLAGILLHQPELILLDEPSNHLDAQSREQLYQWIHTFKGTVVLVSHDRKLLRQINSIMELSEKGISKYGGNYDFYLTQKGLEKEVFQKDLKNKEKELRKAKEEERIIAERKQRLDVRGRKKQEKAGIPTILMNTLRNNAEKSTAKLKGMHTDKLRSLSAGLKQLRNAIPDPELMKLNWDNSSLHKSKILVRATSVNHDFGKGLLWRNALHLEIRSGERIAIKGNNGVGKSTLLKLINGLRSTTGSLFVFDCEKIYIDQEYSLLQKDISVFAYASMYNNCGLEEHEIKIRLNRFLFEKEDWNKKCFELSGGEKMRLLLCVMQMSKSRPDMILLDEPTNNLDIMNLEILSNALKDYSGTLIVISHDESFLKSLNIHRAIELS